MLLGTAAWPEGPGERRALVGRLASGRLADLNRIEAIRLRKLGEGDPDRLADALVPSSLRRLLEGGARALSRAKQTLAYAEKWDRRGTLPASLAPLAGAADLLPCLPRPSALHRSDGTALDRLTVRGPGAEIGELPRPGLAVLGLAGGGVAGFCLALEEGGSALLGAWMVDAWPEGDLELRAGAARRSTSLGAWEEVALPVLRPGEVLLLPVPRFKPLQELLPGAEVRVATAFETMVLRAGPEGIHPTVH